MTKFVGHRKSVQTMATTSDHRLVWSGDSLGIVRIHSVEDRMFLKEINSGGTIYALKCVNANMWLGTSESLQIRNATVLLPLFTFATSLPQCTEYYSRALC